MATINVSTTGSDTTGDGSAGNPYASPGKAAGVAVAGDTISVAAGTYTLTTATANVAGGPVDLGQTNEDLLTRLVAADPANPPVLKVGAGASGTSVVKISGNPGAAEVLDIWVDANGQSAVTGFEVVNGYSANFVRCRAIGPTAYGFKGKGNGQGSRCRECVVWGASGAAAFASFTDATDCAALAGTCPGFLADTGGTPNHSRCVSANNTGASSTGFEVSGGLGIPAQFHACVAYGNGSDGFKFGAYSRCAGAGNCVAHGNGGYGFNANATGSKAVRLRNCAGAANTSGNTNLFAAGQSDGFVDLTGNPYDPALIAALTSGSSLDSIFAAFAPLATGGGAQLRAAGYPAYLDIGVVQHQDAGGGGGATITDYVASF